MKKRAILVVTSALVFALSLTAGPSGAKAEASGEQDVTAYFYEVPVWEAKVPTKVATPATSAAWFIDPQTGDEERCVTPSSGFEFQVNNVWTPGTPSSPSYVVLRMYGIDSHGVKTISGYLSLKQGWNTFKADGFEDPCKPGWNGYDTKTLIFETTIGFVGQGGRLLTNTVPFEFERTDSIPFDLDTFAKVPVLVTEAGVSYSFRTDKWSQPKTKEYVFGLALGDTYGSLFGKRPKDAIELTRNVEPTSTISIETIAPYLENPDGYFTIVGKAANEIGLSQSWSYVVAPVSNALVLEQLRVNNLKANLELRLKLEKAAGSIFKTCKSMNLIFKGGISKSSKTKNIGKKITQKPFVSSKGYHKNKKLDKDKDGIVCER